MLRVRQFVCGLGVLALLAAARPVSAQTEFGWDISVFSDYVWRGLSLSNQPVVQPDLWVSFPLAGAAITIGGWANIEIAKYDDPQDDISQGGGVAGPDLTEFDWWIDYSRTLGLATVTVGATGYVYPNDFGTTSDFNTIELYGKLDLDVPLAPGIAAYYDVDKIKGLYIEGSVSHSLPLGPAFSLDLGVLAGFSAGQGSNNGADVSNFFDNGLTHVDLSASTTLTVGPLSITPQFHFLFNSDEFAKFNSPSEFDEDTKFWFGATVSWSKVFGGE